MSDECKKAIENAFGESQRAARASEMFHEMRENEELVFSYALVDDGDAKHKRSRSRPT